MCDVYARIRDCPEIQRNYVTTTTATIIIDDDRGRRCKKTVDRIIFHRSIPDVYIRDDGRQPTTRSAGGGGAMTSPPMTSRQVPVVASAVDVTGRVAGALHVDHLGFVPGRWTGDGVGDAAGLGGLGGRRGTA